MPVPGLVALSPPARARQRRNWTGVRYAAVGVGGKQVVTLREAVADRRASLKKMLPQARKSQRIPFGLDLILQHLPRAVSASQIMERRSARRASLDSARP